MVYICKTVSLMKITDTSFNLMSKALEDTVPAFTIIGAKCCRYGRVGPEFLSRNVPIESFWTIMKRCRYLLFVYLSLLYINHIIYKNFKFKNWTFPIFTDRLRTLTIQTLDTLYIANTSIHIAQHLLHKTERLLLQGSEIAPKGIHFVAARSKKYFNTREKLC